MEVRRRSDSPIGTPLRDVEQGSVIQHVKGEKLYIVLGYCGDKPRYNIAALSNGEMYEHDGDKKVLVINGYFQEQKT